MYLKKITKQSELIEGRQYLFKLKPEFQPENILGYCNSAVRDTFWFNAWGVGSEGEVYLVCDDLSKVLYGDETTLTVRKDVTDF